MQHDHLDKHCCMNSIFCYSLAHIEVSSTCLLTASYSHPYLVHCPPTPGICLRCNVTANPCVKEVTCFQGRCSTPVLAPDGSACVVTNWMGKTLPGFCQRGKCSTAATAAFYNQQQQGAIWSNVNALQPLALSDVNIDSGLHKGKKVAYVNTALQYWHQTAAQGMSCGFLNGGCGVKVCELVQGGLLATGGNATATTTCTDPRGELRGT